MSEKLNEIYYLPNSYENLFGDTTKILIEGENWAQKQVQLMKYRECPRKRNGYHRTEWSFYLLCFGIGYPIMFSLLEFTVYFIVTLGDLGIMFALVILMIALVGDIFFFVCIKIEKIMVIETLDPQI